jgi:hypothetical protein
VITVGVLVIAAVVSGIYVNWRTGGTPGLGSTRGGRRRASGAATSKPAKTVEDRRRRVPRVPDRSGRSLLDGVIPGGIPVDHVLASSIVFLCVYVLFFSSFFTNFPQGVVDSLATFTIWTQTGGATQVAPPQQYLVWMAIADAPILILGTIGGILAAIQGRDRLWVFIGLWALGITLAYSYISYKTPWIALNMLLPLALLGGFAIREAARLPRWRQWLSGLSCWPRQQAHSSPTDLNYVNYDTDSPRYPYVYVHSTREMLTMLDQIEAIAADQGTGTDTRDHDREPRLLATAVVPARLSEGGFWGPNRGRPARPSPSSSPTPTSGSSSRRSLPANSSRPARTSCDRASDLDVYGEHGPGGLMTRRSAILRLLIGLAISAVFLALTLSRVNLAEVGAAIAAASPAWLLVALGIVIVDVLHARAALAVPAFTGSRGQGRSRPIGWRWAT